MMTSNFTLYATILILLWAAWSIARHERRERRAQDLHLWLNHDRPAPEGWVQVESAAKMIDLLNLCGSRITAISLGARAGVSDGYDVVRHVAVMAASGRYVPRVQIEAGDAVEEMWMRAEMGLIRNNQLQRLHSLTPALTAAA